MTITAESLSFDPPDRADVISTWRHLTKSPSASEC